MSNLNFKCLKYFATFIAPDDKVSVKFSEALISSAVIVLLYFSFIEKENYRDEQEKVLQKKPSDTAFLDRSNSVTVKTHSF